MSKKKKSDLKDYQDNLMQGAKGTIGLGIVTGIGTYGFSRVGSAHPATAPTANATVGALQLANVGNIAGVGMGIAKMPGSKNAGRNTSLSKKPKKQKITDSRLKKMLG